MNDRETIKKIIESQKRIYERNYMNLLRNLRALAKGEGVRDPYEEG